MAKVSTSVGGGGGNAAYRIGNAMSAFGDSMGQFASLLGKIDQKKKNDLLAEKMRKILMEDQDQLESSNMLSQPATVSALEGVKLKKDALGGASLKPPEEIQSAFSLDEGVSPELMAETPTLTSGISGAGDVAPEGAAQGLPAAGAMEPSLGGSAPFMGEVNPAITERAKVMGMEALMKSTPKEAVAKAMQQYQEIAQAAAEAGKPELVYHFLDKKLDFLKNEYNSDTSLIKALVAQMALSERNKVTQDRIDNRLSKPRPGSTSSDPTTPELSSVDRNIASLRREISSAKRNFDDEGAASLQTELDEAMAERDRLLGERKGKRGKKPIATASSPTEPPPAAPAASPTPAQVSGIEKRIRAYIDRGLSPEEAAKRVRAEDQGS